MKSFKPLYVFLLLALTAIVACQTSPTGRKQLIVVPDSQMNQLGAASFAEMKKGNPPLSDSALLDYVMCISHPLLIAAGERPGGWEIQVFEDDSPNAFALPGRKIGIHTGMIELAKTSGQLAAVIGHEIGHVQAKHGSERVSLGMTSQAVQQVAAIVVDGTEYGAATMAALGLGAQFGVLLPYSRTHESEADFIGLEIMARAGFDPEHAVGLWQGMAKLGGQKPPEFMSTHPANQTRINDLNSHMGHAKSLYRKSQQRPDCKKPS